MKRESEKHTNVHYFDAKQIKKVKRKQQRNKQTTKKIVSVMTYCQHCKKPVTKKNKMNNNYFCDNCYDLVNDELQKKDIKCSNNNTPRYINWEEDLDYLYHHFWLEGDI